MKKALFSKWLLALMLVLVLALAACNSDSDDEGGETADPDTSEEGTDDGDGEEESGNEDGIYSIDDFSPEKTNSGDAIDGGTLNFGLMTSSAFEGTLNLNFYTGAPDGEVIDWFMESLLSVDDNYNYTQDGAATFEVIENDDETVTFELVLNENLNWHDGEPVTAEDWAYSHEVIAHPESTSTRYSGSMTRIVGIDEYNKGEADTISGIEVVDDKTLRITFREASPSLLASGLWTYATPKHIFEDIPIAEQAEHDATRKNPIGYGAFKVETITPGESVTYSANEDYWQGAPQLDGVTLKVVAPETVVQALETGEVDLVDSFPTDQYPDVAESLNNVEFLGQIDLAYTYIGFKVGQWDEEAGQNVIDPDAKMADVNLRKAMWYAVDNDAVGERFYNGLRWSATTLIVPTHPDYHDDTIEAPKYDPDEANRLLDEAGYEDSDGDGFREDKNGEELVINFASMEGGDIAQPIANYYIQAWEQVGLKVELVDGRLMEFNSFYDRVEADDPDIDIYQGAWGVGYDVDPTYTMGNDSFSSYSRYSSEENGRLLEAGISPEAMDPEKRKEIYSEWQQLMVDEVPVFPTLYRSVLVPVNERVVNYSIQPGWITENRHTIGVTAEEPVKAE